MNTYVQNNNIPLPQEEVENLDTYTIKEGQLAGVVVKLSSVQPLLLNKVLRSVKMPKRPLYETVTVTGATQTHPLDEESAAETPHGKAIWEYYQEQIDEAQNEQNDRMTTAIFAMGTDYVIPASVNGWEAEHAMLGIDVPNEPRMKKAHLLSTSLEADEISAITTKIMKKSGVAEEAVQEAEDSFRNAVRDRSERPRELADTRGNSQENAQQQMALQRSL